MEQTPGCGADAAVHVPQIDYPEIAEGIMPRHRFMSAYEQRIEPPDRRWQYLLMAAEPYETIAFKVVTPRTGEGAARIRLSVCPGLHPGVLQLLLSSPRCQAGRSTRQRESSGPTGTERPSR